MPRPNPGIYKLCLERLGVQPQESILLDSSSQNLRAAAQLGMKTVKVQSDTARVGFGDGFGVQKLFGLSSSGCSSGSGRLFLSSLCQPVLVPARCGGVKAGITGKVCSGLFHSWLQTPCDLREVSPFCSSVPYWRNSPIHMVETITPENEPLLMNSQKV